RFSRDWSSDVCSSDLLQSVKSFFQKLTRPSGEPQPKPEGDAPGDSAVANTRETGGAPGRPGSEQNTTGPGENDTFVGRVGGQDEGFAGETRSEARRVG